MTIEFNNPLVSQKILIKDVSEIEQLHRAIEKLTKTLEDSGLSCRKVCNDLSYLQDLSRDGKITLPSKNFGEIKD